MPVLQEADCRRAVYQDRDREEDDRAVPELRGAAAVLYHQSSRFCEV